MSERKPIIGLSGGIGSGKSFVAGCFGEIGCLVIDSDELAKVAYNEPNVLQTLQQWWGDSIFGTDGRIDRRWVAHKVFNDSQQRQQLEMLLHPIVERMRTDLMKKAERITQVVAFVWDTPLLFETGLDKRCDATLFVDAPVEQRLERVRVGRNWDAAELSRRENSQWPLDMKRQMSDYVISNTADAGHARRQVRDVLSQILSLPSDGPGSGNQ